MTAISIGAEFAQQIVDSTKAIVGRDVNYINSSGIIIASTDPNRIGEFHEIGYQVVRSAQSTEVNEDTLYRGTKKGINYPISIKDRIVGVIGITGDPKEVSKYGFLLTKISEIFIKEYLMELNTLDDKQRTNKFLLSLLYNDVDGVNEYAGEYKMETDEKYTVVQILINRRCNKNNLNMIEKEIVQEVKALGVDLFTYIYPNEVVCLINQKQYSNISRTLDSYKNKYDSILSVGVGTLEKFQNTYISYHYAKVATKHTALYNRFYTLAENMNLELLVASLDIKVKEQYCHKIVGMLNQDEIELLGIYFEHELSLKETAEKLFIHKNTLQYKLNHIREKTGLDPRNFKNAVTLYLAIRIRNQV